MVVGPDAAWPSFLAPVVQLLLLLTAPVELLGLPAFGGFFVICVVFVITTISLTGVVTHSRFVGEEGATWKAKLLRSSLGILGTGTGKRVFLPSQWWSEPFLQRMLLRETNDKKGRNSLSLLYFCCFFLFSQQKTPRQG